MLGTVQGLHAQALDPNMLQFVGIIDTICTENIVDKDYTPIPWEKEGFHAGMQMGNTVLFTRRADKAYDIPDDVDMYIRLKDCGVRCTTGWYVPTATVPEPAATGLSPSRDWQ